MGMKPCTSDSKLRVPGIIIIIIDKVLVLMNRNPPLLIDQPTFLVKILTEIFIWPINPLVQELISQDQDQIQHKVQNGVSEQIKDKD